MQTGQMTVKHRWAPADGLYAVQQGREGRARGQQSGQSGVGLHNVAQGCEGSQQMRALPCNRILCQAANMVRASSRQ